MASDIRATLLKILGVVLGVGLDILSFVYPDATRVFISRTLGISDQAIVSYIIKGMAVFGAVIIFLIVAITIWQRRKPKPTSQPVEVSLLATEMKKIDRKTSAPPLLVAPLQNDPAITFEALISKNPPNAPDAPPDDTAAIMASAEMNLPTLLKPQFHAVTWKKRGESFDVMTRKPRLRLKFAVLKVTNVVRGITENAQQRNVTNLRAKAKVMVEGVHPLEGGFSPEPEGHRSWSSADNLSWYQAGWARSLRPVTSDVAVTVRAIAQLEQIRLLPHLLEPLLASKTLDTLEVGGDAYLIVCCVTADFNGFFITSDWANRPFGRCRLRISLCCDQFTLDDRDYVLDVRNWNSFDLRDA